MEYDIEVKLSNGNTIYYKLYDGTAYEVGIDIKDEGLTEYSQVNQALMRILKNAEHKDYRLRIWYGDRQTGTAWNEEYDVCGYIGRSGGDIKIPLLINNSRSYGGPALSVGSIIRVDDIEEHRTLWKVNNFHVCPMELKHNTDSKNYPYEVWETKDDKSLSNVANFKTESSARRWIAFMKGERYSK